MRPKLAQLWRLPQASLVALVKGYRLLLSPSLGSSCRFEPSCSAYSLQALQQHGALAGSCLTAHRLARCHPWCIGGYDPVPASLEQKLPSWVQQMPFISRWAARPAPSSSKKNPS